MSKKVITFGEIMLRLATPDYLRFAKPISSTLLLAEGKRMSLPHSPTMA